MALIDSDNDHLVIRVTYDGAAMCGKTTSLEALARDVNRTVTSPAVAHNRTLYFDWMEYVGGWYEGRPIRCQVVTVPGQTVLEGRRWHLIDQSDALVYVMDTTRERFEASMVELDRVQQRLRAVEGVAPGIVLQANKRDAPTAVKLATIRERVAHYGNVAVVESVATVGIGVRHAFVFAVRLGLDRVRGRAQQGTLLSGKPIVDSADQLLAQMQQAEERERENQESSASDLRHTAGQGPEARLLDAAFDGVFSLSEQPPDSQEWDGEMVLPNEEVPTGMVWPPVTGRVILHDCAAGKVGKLVRRSAGWEASSRHWRLRTDDEMRYDDPAEARFALVDWARLHSGLNERLSPSRCLVVTGGGSDWRVWQLVRAELSLVTRLRQVLTSDRQQVALVLLRSARALLEAASDFARLPSKLPCSARNVQYTATAGRPIFVGFLPSPAKLAKSSREECFGESLLRRELAGIIHAAVRSGSIDPLGVIRSLDESAPLSPNSDVAIQTLRAMLIGH